MFWGLTPALDFIEVYKQHISETTSEELNILIVGGADSRHVLKTIARRYRHGRVKLNFFIIEGCVETIAKQLLLLYVALQPQEILGASQKTKIFMELYGNTLIRPAVAKYLTSTANELVKMITNYDYLSEIIPNVSIEIRYKERDYLENLLKFWCSDDEFDICRSWDARLRKLLGVRYDSKVGAFDWDLHMRFHSVGGKQVCGQEYKSFRLLGVAFNWLESEVSKPNRSLACVVIPNGEKFAHHGYLGDMETGPFVAYGLDCEDKNYLKSTNGQNAFRSTDVTERNLMQIFHEIEYECEYEHKTTTDMQLGPAFILESEKKVVDFKATNAQTKKATKCLNLEDVQIKFLSISILQLMKYKEEFKDMFDLIYFASTYLKYIGKELLENVSADKALLLIENQKYVLHYRNKELDEFRASVDDKLATVNLEKLQFDVEKDDYLSYIIKAT